MHSDSLIECDIKHIVTKILRAIFALPPQPNGALQNYSIPLYGISHLIPSPVIWQLWPCSQNGVICATTSLPFCLVVLIKKRLQLRCIHHFKSDLINNMDHMRISGTESSSVILKYAFNYIHVNINWIFDHSCISAAILKSHRFFVPIAYIPRLV